MEQSTNQTLLKSQTVSKQDMMLEYQISNKMEQCTCTLKNRGGYKLGNLSRTKTQSRTVYGINGVCPTLCSGMDHGNTMPHIVVEVKNGNKTTR